MFYRMKQVENQERFLHLVVVQLCQKLRAVLASASGGQRCNVEKTQLTTTTENIIKCFITNGRGDFVWGQSAVGAEEIRGETRNVRNSHGSPRDGFSPPSF